MAASAHGEEVIVWIFWRAFFISQGLFLICSVVFAPRGAARIVLPAVVVVAAAALAAFAQMNTDAGLVWPGLFVPGALALAVGVAFFRKKRAT